MENLTDLADKLKVLPSLEEKEAVLRAFAPAHEVDELGCVWKEFTAPSARVALLSLAAIGQARRIFSEGKQNLSLEEKKRVVDYLVSLDHFYESIGGIVGYQARVLKHVNNQTPSQEEAPPFLKAAVVNISQKSEKLEKRVWEGVLSLPEQGELYPIGGLGSRLGLQTADGTILPAAYLPFSGFSLLEGLVRDVQAREFCYFKRFGKQITIPIALMTSHERHNTQHIRALCEKRGWFGRPKESFAFFSQLLVPVVTAEGDWVIKKPGVLHLQPGGHGMVWRAAQEEGIFDWFQRLGKRHLIVRQINNPIGDTNGGTLALAGVGKQEKKSLGFATCDRLPEAAEGVWVVRERAGKRALTTIEYSDFERTGIKTTADYPANTNLFYVDLEKMAPVLEKTPLPKLILNMKESVVTTVGGERREVLAGRLESLMQNISDSLVEEELSSFLTHNERRHTISATKRKYVPGKSLLETPEGVFYDLLANNHELLERECGFSLPPFPDQNTYLVKGPSTIFLYHPALGPLYHLIAQKVRGGSFSEGSELQLEIADILLENLTLDGSLLIEARNSLGHPSGGVIRYSDQTGKCLLKNVTVRNRGIGGSKKITYWENRYPREESLHILLEGHSEFIAEDVVFEGSERFVVPDGERWVVEQSRDGALRLSKSAADLKWQYRGDGSDLRVEASLDSIYCRSS